MPLTQEPGDPADAQQGQQEGQSERARTHARTNRRRRGGQAGLRHAKFDGKRGAGNGGRTEGVKQAGGLALGCVGAERGTGCGEEGDGGGLFDAQFDLTNRWKRAVILIAQGKRTAIGGCGELYAGLAVERKAAGHDGGVRKIERGWVPQERRHTPLGLQGDAGLDCGLQRRSQGGLLDRRELTVAIGVGGLAQIQGGDVADKDRVIDKDNRRLAENQPAIAVDRRDAKLWMGAGPAESTRQDDQGTQPGHRSTRAPPRSV